MRETQLQKLHLHLDTMRLNPELFILPFFQENAKLSDFRLTKIPSQVTHYAHWQSMSDHLQVSVTILQQILYNVSSHFDCWESYFIYTYISASFIPWNIFRFAWLPYSITIHIYHKTIIPVCQQEMLHNKHCVLQVTLAILLSWSCHIASLHTKLLASTLVAQSRFHANLKVRNTPQRSTQLRQAPIPVHHPGSSHIITTYFH
jgi:hypothetical protein